MKAYLKRFVVVLAVFALLTFIFWFGEIVVFPTVFYLLNTIKLPELNPLTYYTIIVLVLSAIIALFRK
jgi:hypothetical protein